MLANALTKPPPTLPADQGSQVQVNGASVHYQRWGSSGTPLLLVHGFAESTVAWEPVAQILARSHVVYAIDLAGYGYSSYNGNYTLNDQTSLVAGFIRALSINKPVLVGHSLGAAVVGNVALNFAQLTSGVIFADGDALPFAGSAAPHPPGMGLILKSPYAITSYRLITRWDWLSNRLVRAQCGTNCQGLTPELVDAWMRPMRQGVAEQALTAMASAGVLAMEPAQIRAITVPRGIIWGDQDATAGGSLADARDNLGQPQTIMIANAGHLSMVADPAAFAAAVEKLSSGWAAR